MATFRSGSALRTDSGKSITPEATPRKIRKSRSGTTPAATIAISAIAEQSSRQATAVAAASEQASVNVQTVASGSDELAASIAEIALVTAMSGECSAGVTRQTT